jgi:hypothetical protein
LGFKEYEEEEENNFIFQKPISESSYFWIQKLDDQFSWGTCYADDEDIHVSGDFQDFDECLNDYLNNKQFFQIKTLKATYKINLLVDTRETIEDLKYNSRAYINGSDQFELEVLD